MNTTETKVTHTPGKWTIHDDDCPWTCGDARTAIELGEELGHTEILFSIQNESGEPLAYLPWEPLADTARQEELRANAAIVSSAPDMLEALELAQATLETLDTEGDITVDKSVFDKTRAAIAYAKGGAA